MARINGVELHGSCAGDQPYRAYFQSLGQLDQAGGCSSAAGFIAGYGTLRQTTGPGEFGLAQIALFACVTKSI